MKYMYNVMLSMFCIGALVVMLIVHIKEHNIMWSIFDGLFILFNSYMAYVYYRLVKEDFKK